MLWEATGGSVSGTGMTISYAAPDEVGTYTLKATSQAEPNLSATASIEVVSEGDPDPGPTPEPGEWCSRIKFEATSGTPGEHVGISGLPSKMDVVFADITVPDTTTESFAIILDGENSRQPYELLVPLHPTAPIAGGVVNVQINNGSQACNPLSFEIESMGNPDDPAVRGSFARSVGTLQQSIDQQANEVSLDPAALKGDLSKLPTEYFGLGLVQFLIDHPQNDNSLAAIARRESVFTDGKFVEFDVALMDVLYHHFGLAELSRSQTLQPSALELPCMGARALSSAAELNRCMNTAGQFKQDVKFLQHIETALSGLSVIAIQFPVLGANILYANLAIRDGP